MTMRTSILTACYLLTASVQVYAQEAETEEMGASETEGAEVVDSPEESPDPKPRAGARDAAPGEVHVVNRGDTLWDLSQQYLGSAWYWPKVWAYNPEIANPHWIYPGNQVRFFAGGEDSPGRIDVVQADDDGQEASSSLIDGGEGSDLVTTEDAGEDAVTVHGPIGYQQKEAPRVVHEGFVTPKEVEESGTIKAAFTERDMLTFLDEVYVSFKSKEQVKVGSRYIIFRPMGTVDHPKKAGNVGHLTKLLGTMQILKVNGKVVTAKIEQAWDEIVRGDHVGPYGEKLAERITAKPNKVKLDGYIVSALTPYLTMFGEHHVVIVDKGSADGLQPGNTFTIVRQGDRGGDFLDPSEGQDKDFPLESVGTCMALDVKEKASTCLLTRSLRDIVKGDRIMMVPGGSPVAAR
jgi:hypothetical protein